MDCERDCGEILEEKTSASDCKHAEFSPRVMSPDLGGGFGPCSEITSKEIEHGSARSSDSSDTVSASSSKASVEDIVQLNSQILSNSIGETNIPQPSGGSVEDIVQLDSQIIPNSIGENDIPQPSGSSVEDIVELNSQIFPNSIGENNISQPSGGSVEDIVRLNSQISPNSIGENNIFQPCGGSVEDTVRLNSQISPNSIGENNIFQPCGGSVEYIVRLNSQISPNSIGENNFFQPCGGSVEDIVRLNSQISPNSVGENNAPQPSEGSVEDIVRLSSQISPNSIGENNIPQPSGGSVEDIVRLNSQISPNSIGENNIFQPSGGSVEDIVRLNSQVSLNSIGENNIPQPIEGSNRLEECVKEGRESISQLLDVDQACLVENMSPTLSPSIKGMECPEDYDPDSPAYIFNSDSPTMERNDAPPDDLLFSIHVGNNSFSTDDATSTGADLNKSGELPTFGHSLRSGELCQSGEPSKSGECQSGEILEAKECQSTEHLKANESKRSDELGRFGQISPTIKGVELNKKVDMESTMSVDVKHGEKGMVGEPISNVLESHVNNHVDSSTGGLMDTSSKHKPDGTVAKPKKKKYLHKLCRCFKWPSCSNNLPGCSCKRIRWPACSFKWFVCRGCLCDRPSSQLKYPKWAGCCFKCLFWPCLKCRC